MRAEGREAMRWRRKTGGAREVVRGRKEAGGRERREDERREKRSAVVGRLVRWVCWADLVCVRSHVMGLVSLG